MVLEFGDELGGMIEGGNRMPWLIWIQLLILFLLIFLLFSFNLFSTSDLSSSTNSSGISFASAPSSSSSKPSISTNHNNNHSKKSSSAFKHGGATATAATNRFQVRGSQSIKGEIATNKGRRIVRQDPGSSSIERNYIDYHPCNYLRLAKLAFLKCLGLDFMAESSSTSSSEQKKNR